MTVQIEALGKLNFLVEFESILLDEFFSHFRRDPVSTNLVVEVTVVILCYLPSEVLLVLNGLPARQGTLQVGTAWTHLWRLLGKLAISHFVECYGMLHILAQTLCTHLPLVVKDSESGVNRVVSPRCLTRLPWVGELTMLHVVGVHVLMRLIVLFLILI